MNETERTPQQIEEELKQKLDNLKAYHEQYDQAKHIMQHSRDQSEVLTQWHLMEKIEEQYNTLSDWFTEHGYSVIWNKNKQAYLAIPQLASHLKPQTS